MFQRKSYYEQLFVDQENVLLYIYELQENVQRPYNRDSVYTNTPTCLFFTCLLVLKTIIVSKSKHGHLISIILQLLLTKSR